MTSDLKSTFQPSVSADIQLVIISYLDAVEIFNLQLTCRYFNTLVNDYSTTIWRHCLERLCARNKLYHPSFKDLSTGSQLKKVCTDGLYLRKLYLTSIQRGEPLTPIVRELRFPETYGGRSEDRQECWPFGNVHLVPGGRFLVCSERYGPVSLWDMAAQNPEPGQTTKLLAQHQTTGGYVSCVFVGRNNTLYLLYITCFNPEDLPSTFNQSDDDQVYHVERYDILEVKWSEAQDGFSIEALNDISVITIGTDEVYLEDGFLVHLENGVTLVWDFLNDMCATWGQNVPGVTRMLLSKALVMLVNNDGIYAFKIPPLSPVPLKGGYLALSKWGSIALEPLFVLHHERDPPIPHFPKFIGCPWDVEVGVPQLYEVLVPSDNDYTIQRYRFVLNEKQSKSTLRRVQVTRCPESLSAHKSYVYFPCGDYLWTVWEGENETALACSPSIAHFLWAHELYDQVGSECADTSTASPEIGLATVQFASRGEGMQYLGFELDPCTRKAVALCHSDERRWIEVFTF